MSDRFFNVRFFIKIIKNSINISLCFFPTYVYNTYYSSWNSRHILCSSFRNHSFGICSLFSSITWFQAEVTWAAACVNSYFVFFNIQALLYFWRNLIKIHSIFLKQVNKKIWKYDSAAFHSNICIINAQERLYTSWVVRSWYWYK